MAIAALAPMMLGSAIPQVMSLFSNNDKYYKDVNKAIRKGTRFSEAAADPNSKMFKAAQEEEAGRLRKEAIRGADEMFKLQRKLKARGYGGMVANPERRDEQRSRALMQAFEQASYTGGKVARDRLNAAAAQMFNYAQPALQMGDRARAEAMAKQQTVQNLSSMAGSFGSAALQQFMPRLDQDIASWARRDLPNFFSRDLPSAVNDLFSVKRVSK